MRGPSDCRVYWGSHGCGLGHGHPGSCRCDCCDCGPLHPFPNDPDRNLVCVGAPPYFGPDTQFYGDDVAARGLS
jgi:hypothetical protein